MAVCGASGFGAHPPMNIPKVLYHDRLIEITDQEMVFQRYYFPFGGDKHVPLRQIQSVQIRPPSLWFGSWRIWGGDFVTWFPLDWAKPSRDAIFMLFRHGCLVRIGFTVEHSKAVTAILTRQGLLQSTPSAQHGRRWRRVMHFALPVALKRRSYLSVLCASIHQSPRTDGSSSPNH